MTSILLSSLFYQDQYIFIHDVVLESVTCGDTQIDAGNLRTNLDKLLRTKQSENTEMDIQFAVSTAIVLHHFKNMQSYYLQTFQILNQVSLNPKDAKCVAAKQNPKKNRSSEFLPGN